jgi:phosphohistidine swiveling domain-containing protein
MLNTAQAQIGPSGSLYLLHELPPDPELIGVKAANLRRAADLGLKIPETAVIPTSVYDTLLPYPDLSAAAMRNRIRALDLTGLAGDIRVALLERFGSVRFAVRSSSNLEDHIDRSFAGQYDSFLDVPIEEIEQAVRNCWLSLWRERAVSYRGSTATRPSMAVMIQPFLQGHVGGVAFSANPVTGNPFEVVIEYANNGPSGVTDGTVPTRLMTLDLHEVMLRGVGEPFQSIAEACIAFERPVDLEWIWNDRGDLHVLQVRPITGVRKFVQSNARIAGYELPIPEPLSRLGASLEFEKNRIYQRTVRRVAAPRFRSKMLVLYGRLYLFEEGQKSGLNIRAAASLPLSLCYVPAYVVGRRRLRRNIARSGSARDSLLVAVRRYLSFYRASLYVGNLYNSCTGLLVRYLNAVTAGRYSRPLLYNLLHCPRSVAMTRDRKLRDLAARLLPADERGWLSAQSPEFKAAYESYCREFGYVFADTNPRDPNCRVDHELAFRLLQYQQRVATDGAPRAWEHEVFGVIQAGRFGWIHLRLFRLLRFIYRHSVGLVKEDRNHTFYVASARIREFIGREQEALRQELHLDNVQDLYFMTLGEISSRTGSPRLTRYRRRAHQLSREFVDPLDSGGVVAASNQAVPALTGIPCSPGIASGPVVFVRTRRDFARVSPGSILVADNLRPFWTPVLAGARGLLSSNGNILSHGASVAREHGVPAVFGLGDAVFSLREGETVSLNGLTGQVYRNVSIGSA